MWFKWSLKRVLFWVFRVVCVEVLRILCEFVLFVINMHSWVHKYLDSGICFSLILPPYISTMDFINE